MEIGPNLMRVIIGIGTLIFLGILVVLTLYYQNKEDERNNEYYKRSITKM